MIVVDETYEKCTRCAKLMRFHFAYTQIQIKLIFMFFRGCLFIWKCDWLHFFSHWINYVRFIIFVLMIEQTYHPCSLPIESILIIGMHGIGFDEFYQPDIFLSNHQLLCMCRFYFDGCFVWRIPSSHHNCKSHNVCLNYDHRILCMVYPRDDRL